MRLIGLVAMCVVVAMALGGEELVIAESTFDEGPEGWTFPASAGWDPGIGNPGGCLFGAISEPKNITPTAHAPAAFLGDWSSLDGGAGEIRFDFALLNLGQGDTCGISRLSPEISGPGGRARWNGPLFEGPVAFTTYVASIREDEWTLVGGDWGALLADVTALIFQLELVCNGGPGEDLNVLDNVRLVRLATACPADVNEDGVLDFFDVLVFVGWLADDDLRADWNEDSVLDFFDVIAYVGEFDEGCP